VSGVVVADASPLIAFQQIGRLDLLRTVFGELTVPPAVAREILPSVPLAAWQRLWA
jgi:predicted nucleic acid-binding protein